MVEKTALLWCVFATGSYNAHCTCHTAVMLVRDLYKPLRGPCAAFCTLSIGKIPSKEKTRCRASYGRVRGISIFFVFSLCPGHALQYPLSCNSNGYKACPAQLLRQAYFFSICLRYRLQSPSHTAGRMWRYSFLSAFLTTSHRKS